MKRRISNLLAVAVISIAGLRALPCARATTTIDPADRLAWGANLGWMDCRADTNHGAVIGEYVCSGFIYSANVGWINLGGGAPTNGVYYQNASAGDFGVNQDGLGNLRGCAWGANIGWILFETNGAPRVDLATGNLSGYAWSANCGWISLSNATALVRTDRIAPGADSDTNGLPDAWEIQNFGRTGTDPNADPDHDGICNLQEYLAGTDPNDAADRLQITGIQRGSAGDSQRIDLQWTAEPTRFYTIQASTNLSAAGAWSAICTLPTIGTGSASFTDPNGREFYRIQALRPLGP